MTFIPTTADGHAVIAYYDEHGTAVFSASAVGSCEGALVRSLRGFIPEEAGEDMQRRFADGHLHEESILKAIEGQGWAIHDSQKEVRLHVNDGIVIVGHIDGIADKLVGEGIGTRLHAVAEAKSMSQSSFDRWINQGFEAYPKYAQQITVYMAALQMPAVYACKNKNSGQVDIQLLEAPPWIMAKIKAKLIRVVKAEKAGRMPACPNPFDYPCPFYDFHEDRGSKKAPKPKADPDKIRGDLEGVAFRYEEASAQEKYWSDLKTEYRDEILGQLGEEDAVLTDNYEVRRTVVKSRRLDTKRLRAAMDDLTQFETESTSTRLEIKPR